MQGLAIILFTDLVGSTAMLARLGDDRMNQIVQRHLADVDEAVREGGGRVVKSTGDGAMATFSSALGALRAAAAVQDSAARLDAAEERVGIAVRIGVSAGEPIAVGDDLHGMPVVIAARLCDRAPSGGVLVHDVVQMLVGTRDGADFEDAESFELKGVPDGVRAARLRWTETPRARETVPSPGFAGTLPRWLAAFDDSPLVARDAELREIEAALAGGGRRAVLLLGEPGIGKTRLAAATAAKAHAGGAFVVLARCPPEALTPFEPWVRAISELARQGERTTLAAAAGAELCALVPELADLAPAGSGTDAAEAGRYRVLRGIAAVLATAAGDRDLCVVLDDAHWCDPASTQVLTELLEGDIALIVTARERELGRGHPVSRALGDLRRTRELCELKLGGLDASGLAALVAARVGRAITPRVAARLLARTRGNPFFAGELVQDLDDRGGLQEAELDRAPVPDAVAGLVDERLSRLDPDTERFLIAAAAVGPTAPVALVAAATGLGDASGAVAQAVAERLIDEAPALEPTVAFPHALIREAFAAMLDPVAAARLHHAIAEALGGDAEPAELARHRALAAPITGPEPAIAAHRAAASAAAAGHDHEAAAGHLDEAVALLPAGHADRGRLLLAAGDERLLAADLRLGRVAYLGACEEARRTGDAVLLSRAALGFCGGEIGFLWEAGGEAVKEPSALLREALAALGNNEPRLRLGLLWRLIYNDVFDLTVEESERIAGLADQAIAELPDAELPTMLANFRRFGELAASREPILGPLRALVELAPLLDRNHADDEWRLRELTWAAHAAAVRGDPAGCDAQIERMAEVAKRLDSPRFLSEVELMRVQRMIERGDSLAGLEAAAGAAAVLGRLRPDLQVFYLLAHKVTDLVFFRNDLNAGLIALRSLAESNPWGLLEGWLAFLTALRGDHEAAWARVDALLGEPDLATLRTPGLHLNSALVLLSYTAERCGHREAGARLRPMLEPLRPYLIYNAPTIAWGHPPELAIGLLESLAANHDAAVLELHAAVARADAAGIFWVRCWGRIMLARAMHRAGEDASAALKILAEGEELARAKGAEFFLLEAAAVRAEMDGRPLVQAVPESQSVRPVRALAARSGRRALAALVRGHDDVALERRFLAPRRQRSLLRAMARGFQPGMADGFEGVIAYEIEPFAVPAPPDAPWRWAIEVRRGSARLIEPAPLDADVTVHFGLADWVRVMAGELDPVTAMAGARCRVEGDVVLASRLEPMFGAR